MYREITEQRYNPFLDQLGGSVRSLPRLTKIIVKKKINYFLVESEEPLRLRLTN
nr:MAG TPA: hypothetical protein [Herelleviridae sp.]